MLEDASLIEVAGTVCAHFASKGIDVVVVGGSAITVHLPEIYTSHDIDFAVPSGHSLRQIAASLAEIGFKRRGREFVSPDTIYSIDIVADIPFIEQEPIYDYALVNTAGGMLKVFHIEDAISDRICAFVHWSDSESLDVAERALHAARQHIDPRRLAAGFARINPEGKAAHLRLQLARTRLQNVFD